MKTDEGNSDSFNLDDKKGMKVDSSCLETTHTDDVDHVLTHPAVLTVFRTDNILEAICSHLDLDDLKQFRLVSRTCNDEGRRAIVKLDRHWVVVKSRDYVWQLKLDRVLTKLEETTSDGGENSNTTLLGWIFKGLELNNWEHSFGHPYFLQHWGHYLRKIHLNADKDVIRFPTCNDFYLIKTIHQLLTVSCPNLNEMVVDAINIVHGGDLSSVSINELESLEFPSPLLKLKYLRIMNVTSYSDEEGEVVPRFFAKLITAGGTALETLEIDYNDYWEMEVIMLERLALNVGVSNFQSLQELSLRSAEHVINLPHTVQQCFPKLKKLILFGFDTSMIAALAHPASYQASPECFPALKSLTILEINCRYITNDSILYFLQHFPNLEVLKVSLYSIYDEPEILDPLAPRCLSLRSLNLKTQDFDLRPLRAVVKQFPNIITLNLLEFESGESSDGAMEPEYSFGELIDIVSPLGRLQHLYVNHAFHTPLQLADAIHLTSNLTGLKTFILSQAAHYYSEQKFNVSLYLTNSDPEFQNILDCDSVMRLQSVRFLYFRFGTTEEEVEEEAAAKGGHVSFGGICPGHVQPWICGNQTRSKTCPGWDPVY